MFNKATIFSIALAVLALPSAISADTKPPSYPPKVAYMLLANEYSAKMGVSLVEVKTVLKSESGYDQDAIGDHGKARSCAQYHKETFDQYESFYSNATGNPLNYNSCVDQIKLMTWQWKVFPSSKSEWSTWRAKFGIMKRHHIKR